MVKNGCGKSGDGTLKLTVSEEWTDGINGAHGTNSGKLKVNSMIFGWVWFKMAITF